MSADLGAEHNAEGNEERGFVERMAIRNADPPCTSDERSAALPSGAELRPPAKVRFAAMPAVPKARRIPENGP